jgi:hypothetical protein
MQGKRGRVEVRQPLGRAAFQAHFAKISRNIVVGQDNPETREVAHAIARARQWAESGDYLAALHAIGGLEVTMARPTDGAGPNRVSGADVEEALGALRREVERVGEVEGAVEAAQLWEAARQEVIRGSWEAAMALVEEARQWLGRGK